MFIWHWILEMCSEEHLMEWWMPWAAIWLAIGLPMHWIAWKQAPSSWPGHPEQKPTRLGLICHELEFVCVVFIIGPQLLVFHQVMPWEIELVILCMTGPIFITLFGFAIYAMRQQHPTT